MARTTLAFEPCHGIHALPSRESKAVFETTTTTKSKGTNQMSNMTVTFRTLWQEPEIYDDQTSWVGELFGNKIRVDAGSQRIEEGLV